MNPLNFIFSETNKTLIGDWNFPNNLDQTKSYDIYRNITVNGSIITTQLTFKQEVQQAGSVIVSGTDLIFTINNHGYIVGDTIKFFGSTSYANKRYIVKSVTDTNTFKVTKDTNDTTNEPAIQVYRIVSTASRNLIVDSKGNLRHGKYIVTDSIVVNGLSDPFYPNIVTIFSYCFDIPVVKIAHSLDCGKGTYTVTDATSYSVDEVTPTFVTGRELSLLKDNSKPVVVNKSTSLASLTIPSTGTDLYAGSYTTTVKSGALEYTYPDYKVQVQFTGTSKYDVQCDKGICDIFCGINTLRKNMESAKLTNPTQYIKLRDLFVLISAYVESYYMAKKCKNEEEASAILNIIKSLGGFTDNCCGSGDLENYKIIPFDSCGCGDTETGNCEPYENSYIDGNVTINSKTEVQMNNFSIRLDIQGNNASGQASSPYLQVMPINYCGKQKIKLSRIIIVTNDAGNKSYAGILIFNNIFGSDVVAGQGNSFNETSIIIPSIGDNTFCILENSNFNMVTGGGIVGSEIPNGGLPTVSSFTSQQGLTTDLALGDLGLDSKYGLSTGNIVLPIEGSRTVSGSTHILRTIDQTPLLFKYKNTNLAGGFNGKLTVVLEGIII